MSTPDSSAEPSAASYESIVQDMAPEKPQRLVRAEGIAMNAAAKASVVLNRLLPTRRNDRIGVITYHRVAPIHPGVEAPSHNVQPDNFRAQLSGLVDRGYRFASLSELLTHHRNGTMPPDKTITVTFDDGYGSVFEHALPAMSELGIPSTIFVNTAYLDSDRPFPFDAWALANEAVLPLDAYRPLRRSECRAMADSGLVEIGAHTHTHRDLRDDGPAFQQDIEVNLTELDSFLAPGERTFAYPVGSPHNGFAGGPLEKAAVAAGVTCGLTTEPALVDLTSNPFAWGRFNSFDFDTAATLSAKVEGWYSWAPRARKRTESVVRSAMSRSA